MKDFFGKVNKYKYIMLAVAVIFLDQIAKLLVVKFLSPTGTVHVIPKVFDFVFVKNKGAAFSILQDYTVFLGIISIMFCIAVILFWYKCRPKSAILKSAASLLFAGAFGNAIDRIFRGYVIDFISTAFMSFPVFNVADIAITFGAVLILIYSVFFDKDENIFIAMEARKKRTEEQKNVSETEEK